jgi:CheY-like chemotaxis protein
MTVASAGKQILVVDDSATCAQIMATVLRQIGHSVTIARNGYLAYRLAAQRHFDLVLTDEQMPIMNGSELCRRLRTHERYKETPFILFTSKNGIANLDGLRKELNIAGVIHKENRKSRIPAIVESALRGKKDEG